MKKLFSYFFLFVLIILNANCQRENFAKPKNSKKESQIKIAASQDPSSFDPRIARDLPTVTVLKMLYEGLVRINPKGVLEPALAEKISVSEDAKIYTFFLRPSRWSDGQPLTAYDFEKTWKSILSPDFPAPNAYQLFVIKNAKQAKEGTISLEEVGIKAISHEILVVELEKPIPYFLELVSCHFYFPVSEDMRNSFNENGRKVDFPSNGPFKCDYWKPRNEFSAVKNFNYWDNPSVKLDRITFQILEENTALLLYKGDKLDWAGSPLSTLPQDAIDHLKKTGVLKIAPGAGTQWFRFNTEKPPFHNEKMRRAFSLALNRSDIVEHITQGGQTPAIGITPPLLGLPNENYFSDHDDANAKLLFERAKEEIEQSQNELTNKKLPKIVLLYTANDRNLKIAQTVQQQWNKVFNTQIDIQSNEGQVLLDRMHNGDYQIALGGWFADIHDPINFLEIFQSRTTQTNQTFWEDRAYQSLLEHSWRERDREKRFLILSEAEKLLMHSMPVAPIFHYAFNYLVQPNLKGVYFSNLGYLDFKYAFIERQESDDADIN